MPKLYLIHFAVLSILSEARHIDFHTNNAAMDLCASIEVWLKPEEDEISNIKVIKARRALAELVVNIAQKKFSGCKRFKVNEIANGSNAFDDEGLLISWNPPEYNDLKASTTAQELARLAEPFVKQALEVFREAKRRMDNK